MLLHATTWRRAGRLFLGLRGGHLSLRDRADICENCLLRAVRNLSTHFLDSNFLGASFVRFCALWPILLRECLGFDLCMARAGGAHYRKAKVVSVVEESRRSPSLLLPPSTLPLSSSLPPSLPSEGGPPSNGRSRQAVLVLLSGGGGGRNEGEEKFVKCLFACHFFELATQKAPLPPPPTLTPAVGLGAAKV